MTQRYKGSEETLKGYKIRLYKNKEQYGLSNVEIGELINKESGENLDESAYRKWATPYIEGYKDAVVEGVTDDDLVAEMDDKKDELYRQQVKTRDKLREYRTEERNTARVENLKDTFVKCAVELANSDPVEVKVYPRTNGDRVGILTLSDWHYGEIIDDFLNTYNKKSFDERIEKLTNDTIKYCELMNVKTLKVLNLGDLMSGNIHVSSRVNSEENIVEQTMYVAETLAKMLLSLSEHIEVIKFHSILDNHSRINKSKFEHIEKESFGMFIPWFLKPRIAHRKNIEVVENRVEGYVEENIGIVDIYNEKAFFVHGHQDRVASAISDLTLMTKIFPVAVFIGHLHQNLEKEVHGVDLIMNPSLIGVGDYAKGIRKTSKARQKLTIYEQVDNEVERVGSFFLNLDN